MRATPRVDEAVQHLKGIFLEVPNTELTVNDACTMTGLEHYVCSCILEALADVRFLRRRGDGVFIAAHAHASHVPTMVLQPHSRAMSER